MIPLSQFSSPGFDPNTPTVGSLKHRIMIDNAISEWEKQRLLAQVESSVGNVPDSTPLSLVNAKIAGGALGWLLSKYFGLSLPGQVIATAAGYGVGKIMNDFYNGFTGQTPNLKRWL